MLHNLFDRSLKRKNILSFSFSVPDLAHYSKDYGCTNSHVGIIFLSIIVEGRKLSRESSSHRILLKTLETNYYPLLINQREFQALKLKLIENCNTRKNFLH